MPIDIDVTDLEPRQKPDLKLPPKARMRSGGRYGCLKRVTQCKSFRASAFERMWRQNSTLKSACFLDLS
jgi:hypothetical protein